MIKTSHTILDLNKSQKNLLDSVCDLYTKTKHTGFKMIAKANIDLFKNNQLNKSNEKNTKDIITSLSSEQKKLLATNFNLTGRHVNSINIELGMIISSYIEQRNNHLADLNHNLTQIHKSILKYQKYNSEIKAKYSVIKANINFNSSILKQVHLYKQFIITNKAKNKTINIENKSINNSNKLQFIFNYSQFNLPSVIKSNTLKTLLKEDKYKHIDMKLLTSVQKYGKNIYHLHLLQKKSLRIKNKITKIENDISQGKLRICFGGKALFKQQSFINYNPQSILFKDHIDWLTSWYDSRSHQFLLTGAGEEISGNQNCQAHLNEVGLFNLKLRIPDKLNKDSNDKKSNKPDKYLIIKNVDFGKNNPLLQSSLLSETKEVRILTIAEKQEIKDLKSQVFELKKVKFRLNKEVKLLSKCIVHLNMEKFNQQLKSIDNQIIELQKEIDFKSDIFDLSKGNNNINTDNELNNIIRTRQKKLAIPITYRFVKNTERNSPKYGSWSLHFTVEVKEPQIITDISLGTIGIDLNANHLAVSEIDNQGKLIQSFNIYLNPETYNEINKHNNEDLNKNKPLNQKDKSKNLIKSFNKPLKLIDSNNHNLIDLPIVEGQFKFSEKNKDNYLAENSSNKTENILGNALKIITDLSLRTGKPIVIEKLDFTQKKQQLISYHKLNKNLNHSFNNKTFNYNHMLSSFAYSQFKEIIKSQAARSGLQVIEVNPAYSSLIGVINYAKPLGLSAHMAASYVIAQRGFNLYKINNKTLNKDNSEIKISNNNYKIDEKPRLITINNTNKLEIYTKSKVHLVDYIVNSDLSEDVPKNEWSIVFNLYKDLQKKIYKEKLQKKLQKEKLNSLMKSSPNLSNESDLNYLLNIFDENSSDNLQVHDTQ